MDNEPGEQQEQERAQGPPAGQCDECRRYYEKAKNGARRGVEWLPGKSALVQALCAVAIVSLTWGMWTTSDQQWQAMSGQLIEMRDANATARKELILANRAWLVVKNVEMLNGIPEREPAKINVVIINAGRSPATAQAFTATSIWPPGQQRGEVPWPNESSFTLTVGPGLEGHVTFFTGPFPEPIIVAAQAEEVRISVHILIKYSDPFAPDWETEACATFVRAHEFAETNKFELVACHDHNRFK